MVRTKAPEWLEPSKIRFGITDEMIIEFLPKLTPQQQLVVNFRYGLNGGTVKSIREVAEKIDRSKSYASQVEKRAFRSILRFHYPEFKDCQIKSVYESAITEETNAPCSEGAV